VHTYVDGDLAGPARLEIAPDGGDRCTARLQWELELRKPGLRVLAAPARPLLGWAHDKVVASGFEGFVRRALPPTEPGAA
jgi:hypothetical protein